MAASLNSVILTLTQDRFGRLDIANASTQSLLQGNISEAARTIEEFVNEQTTTDDDSKQKVLALPGIGQVPQNIRDGWTQTLTRKGFFVVEQNAYYLVSSEENAFNLLQIFFDGVDESINCSTAADVQFERTDTFSISVWIRSTSFSLRAETLIGNEAANATRRGWSLELQPGNFPRLRLVSDESAGTFLAVTSIQNFLDHEFVHVAATYDGSSAATGITLYINGVAVPTTSEGAASIAATTVSTANLLLGATNAANTNYQGVLDEMAVFSSELTAGSVTTIYNNGLPNDISAIGGLIHWWRMGEGSIFPTITDEIGTLDGTMTNMEEVDFIGFGGCPPVQPALLGTSLVLIAGDGISIEAAGSARTIALSLPDIRWCIRASRGTTTRSGHTLFNTLTVPITSTDSERFTGALAGSANYFQEGINTLSAPDPVVVEVPVTGIYMVGLDIADLQGAGRTLIALFMDTTSTVPTEVIDETFDSSLDQYGDWSILLRLQAGDTITFVAHSASGRVPQRANIWGHLVREE